MELRQDGYQALVRRAELFTYIADLVRTQEDPPESPADSGPDVKLTLLPKIQVFGQGVVCNGSRLDLARRPLSLKLFRLFCEKDDMTLTRPELVDGIYDLKDKPFVSERHLEALYVNAVKLVSRTRILAAAYLGRGAARGIEWFGYDADAKAWTLYRLRSEYLSGSSAAAVGGPGAAAAIGGPIAAAAVSGPGAAAASGAGAGAGAGAAAAVNGPGAAAAASGAGAGAGAAAASGLGAAAAASGSSSDRGR